MMHRDPSIVTARHDRGRIVRRSTAIISLLAVAVWLGGLVALGAIAAPVVFAVVPWPSSADAMTVVFQRFDLLAMTCAALVLGAEAVRAAARVPFTLSDSLRAAVCALAAILAVFAGTSLTPRIAALHRAGATRGTGPPGMELARLHDLAEWCGNSEVALLALVVVLQVVALSTLERSRGEPSSS